MKFYIKHETPNRMRISMNGSKMTIVQADMLEYYLSSHKEVRKVKVFDRTADATIEYTCSRDEIIDILRRFKFNNKENEKFLPEVSGRELNNTYMERLMSTVFRRLITRYVIPAPFRAVFVSIKAVKYVAKGVRTLAKGKLEVTVLDATAIGVSILRKDYKTAGSVMFLLKIGELLEEWTHKKSVDDLARSMSLNIEKVWLLCDGSEIQVPVQNIKTGDTIIIHMGNLVPFDGVVINGEGMCNQSSLTGEAIPVRKIAGSYVYAGTVLEEGEIRVQVRAAAGSTRYEKIVKMIEDSEKLKSNLESNASHLADVLVPYSFIGTALTYLITRNTSKALSILMVDFSCALKLSMPIAVLSAMKECSGHDITVKGGKYLEAVAAADTIVFDKTGTLTKAEPTVALVVPFNNKDRDNMLRIAACLEEHFPHSMAKAVVVQAEKENLQHAEMHSKVEYIVAHGISSYVEHEKVVIGSYHFVFEDEGCVIANEDMDRFKNLSPNYSHLYMAISGRLAAVICIEDPIRDEAKSVLEQLSHTNISKVVMMTGDSKRTAMAIAEKIGVDEFYAEVLPEDKARYIEREKASGRKVIMVGDGINDSPALSAADAGIAISEGAWLAREIADITISADDLYALLTLKSISDGLMRRINLNYKVVVSFNMLLIILGVAGMIAPGTSALLHNASTVAISLKSMTDVYPE